MTTAPSDTDSTHPCSAPWVRTAVKRAACGFAKKFGEIPFASVDDYEQHCWLLLFDDEKNPNLREYNEANSGLLVEALDRDLRNDFKDTHIKRYWTRDTSFEKRYETEDEAGEYSAPAPRITTFPEPLAAYTVEVVKSLLPYVWDWHEWGLQLENAPDADMPRGKRPMSTMGLGLAMAADIRSAWKRSLMLTDPHRLSDRQRQVLCLRYGLGFTWREVAATLGVTEATVKESADGVPDKRGGRTLGALAKLTQSMNGVPLPLSAARPMVSERPRLVAA